MRRQITFVGIVLSVTCATPAAAQVDQALAAQYFKEAAVLCEREGGRLWGVSLCGPMVFADPATHTIATNKPAPAAPQPAVLGYANAALDWGGTRWTTVAWPLIPSDERMRGILMLHELFHRVQPQLGLFVHDGENAHLDTLEGRYWIQLEWRALARALGETGAARTAAVRDALTFRAERRKRFPAAAGNEQLLEINEGLAQYTGTVAGLGSSAAAAQDAVEQLSRAEHNATFVRTFPYASGAAYGILLDGWSPGWTRRIKSTDDIGQLLSAAAAVQPSDDPEAAAAHYDGAALMTAERTRDVQQKARVAELRRRFVDGPVLVLPGTRSASFLTAGMTPIPGEGTVYPTYRTTGEWGSLEAAMVLVATDRSKLTLPAPARLDVTPLTGEGWTLTVAPGWVVRPGPRPGDFQLVRKP